MEESRARFTKLQWKRHWNTRVRELKSSWSPEREVPTSRIANPLTELGPDLRHKALRKVGFQKDFVTKNTTVHINGAVTEAEPFERPRALRLGG